MKEKNKTKYVLEKMKARRGNDTIILFHEGKNCEAYGNDAQIIASELTLETFVKDDLPAIRFPWDKQEEVFNRLLDKGYAVCISEMWNDSGNFIVDIAEYE